MGGEAVTEAMNSSFLGYTCQAYCLLHALLNRGIENMMPPHHPGTRINRESSRGKDILPGPLSTYSLILPGQCRRDIDLTIALGKVVFVYQSYFLITHFKRK